METEKILNKFILVSKNILKDNLVGIYLHGSYAMNCYNPNISDIDLIVVVNSAVLYKTKLEYMKEIVKSNYEIGGKGLEISIVKQEFCSKNMYPIPYELHFSSIHLEKYKQNPNNYISNMKGVDKDLSAHFKMIYHRGKKLYGKDIDNIFLDIKDEYYISSILNDIKDYEDEIDSNNVYVILNLCRTLSYLKENLILSKKEGGEWALNNLNVNYYGLIKEALLSYETGKEIYLKNDIEKEFVSYMLNEIENIEDLCDKVLKNKKIV